MFDHLTSVTIAIFN